jgi:glutamine synthetase
MMTFKLAVKTVAHRHGLHATFMPKQSSGSRDRHAPEHVLVEREENAFASSTDKNGLSRSPITSSRHNEAHQGNHGR